MAYEENSVVMRLGPVIGQTSDVSVVLLVAQRIASVPGLKIFLEHNAISDWKQGYERNQPTCAGNGNTRAAGIQLRAPNRQV